MQPELLGARVRLKAKPLVGVTRGVEVALHDESDHRAVGRSEVRHPSVPHAQIADKDRAPFTHRTGRTAWPACCLFLCRVSAAEHLSSKVRAWPIHGGSIVFGYVHHRNVDCDRVDRTRWLGLRMIDMWLLHLLWVADRERGVGPVCGVQQSRIVARLVC
jgi:hypothetical protein